VSCHILSKIQTFYYTRRITPKRVTSWRCPSPRHTAKAIQLPAYCWSGGEPFAKLCKIWPAFGKRTLYLSHTRHAR